MTSLVTRCPACSTLFKVVPDQLRISEGWVRCGQCDEVFDANLHMQPPMHLEQVSLQPHTPVPASVQPQRADELVVMVSSELVAKARQDTVDLGAVEQDLPIGAQSAAIDLESATPSADATSESSVGGAYEDDSPIVASESASPEFMQATYKATEVGRHPKVRWMRWLLVVFLVLLLAGQWMVHERDRIAALLPTLKPVLVSGCEALGCVVRPLRRIESVVIESSSFVKVKADVYRLTFSVRNTAAWPLAMPSAELTLTDSHDQSVFRRVLSPSDLSVPTPSLAAAEELTVMVPISIKVSPLLAEKISGYRLLVFYP